MASFLGKLNTIFTLLVALPQCMKKWIATDLQRTASGLQRTTTGLQRTATGLQRTATDLLKIGKTTTGLAVSSNPMLLDSAHTYRKVQIIKVGGV